LTYTTAGWIITKKGEVLLKQTVQALDNGDKIICYEPIKGRVFSGELALDACRRIIRETLNTALPANYQRYFLTRIIEPIKEIREDFTFEDINGTKNKLGGIRWHFFHTITPERVLDFLPSLKFKLLKKEDCEKVRKLTEIRRKPPKYLEQKTVLYDFDHNLLINRMWEIQKVLAPIR